MCAVSFIKKVVFVKTDMPLHLILHFTNLVFCLFVIQMVVSYGKPKCVLIFRHLLCCRCGGELKTFKADVNNEHCAH
jgi:hypothetical protein